MWIFIAKAEPMLLVDQGLTTGAVCPSPIGSLGPESQREGGPFHFLRSRHCEQLRPRLDLLVVEVPTPSPGESPSAASRPLAAESDRAGEVRGSRYADSFRRPVATSVPGLAVVGGRARQLRRLQRPCTDRPFSRQALICSPNSWTIGASSISSASHRD